ncbi:uncharacterized protein LOC133779251 [Humulus lupulus]|uniref:uncharacterized protein LOC133779251 n=1 Tax=Humulus lupulus TaxID=3486 RepID=UPI002B4133DC|nr:uncharacterized protein LOC133779251 [Humulus lupulus]
MWTELNTKFNQGNGLHIFDLRTSPISLHQGDDSVRTYFTKLKAIWDKINELRPRTPCTCAATNDSLELQNLEHVLQFLTGLNEYYRAIHSQRQRKIRPSATTSLIVASTSTAQSSNPPSLPSSRTKKMRLTCSHCQKSGHLKEKCYFIHGFPHGYGTRNVNNKPTVNQATACTSSSQDIEPHCSAQHSAPTSIFIQHRDTTCDL